MRSWGWAVGLAILGCGAGSAGARGADYNAEMTKFCDEVRGSFKALKWDLDPCNGVKWEVGGKSVNGRPLVYAEWGNAASGNTTLVFAAVHGDEVTPVYLGFALANFLQSQSVVRLGEPASWSRRS